MKFRQFQTASAVLSLGIGLLFCSTGFAASRSPATSSESAKPVSGSKQLERQDDSFNPKPAKDLILRPEGQRKADALAHYLEGMAFEENGELGKALTAYREVLNVDPGEADLACRVASLLTRQDDFPAAIDVLKDAVKATPTAAEPYLQLAFIYAKYLKKVDQALEYGNKAISLDPTNIDAYQRLYE